ncbi:MAG: lanthionine synthetase LanC family protein [Candidatus Aminicenantales bacterium]
MKHAMRGVGTVLILCLPFFSDGVERPAPAVDETYWQAAAGAARWLDASAVRTDDGLEWPPDPADPKTLDSSLYSGTPGVVLFYLEAGAAAEARGLKPEAAAFFEKAREGAATLLGKISRIDDPGLYTGLAGFGYVLEETYKATGEARFRKGFEEVLIRIRSLARKAGKGVEWSPTTDIIGGTAGVGLFLLYSSSELKDAAWIDLAARAGDRLLEIGKPKNGSLDWAMDPSSPRTMPNFAHGTAGAAFFLSRLYEETKKGEYLEAALAGARYLLSIAETKGDGCLIYHHEPDGTDLYYLGWCHGPVGTANLFYQLSRVTGDSTWFSWVGKEARSLMDSGIPEKQTPGFWNNAGLCCGLAGVADFFLRLYPLSKDSDHLEFGRRVMRMLREKTVEDAGRMKWPQAEYRTRPEFLVAQTGLMQGAAGIGLVFLRWDAFANGRRNKIRLPDSSF